VSSCGWIVDGRQVSERAYNTALLCGDRVRQYRRTPRLFAAWLSEQTASELSASGFRVYRDLHLNPFADLSRFDRFSTCTHAPRPGLNQVLELIGAPFAWSRATGDGVCLAVVDSGINGVHPEFPSWKQAGGWAFDNSNPWTDRLGHGTMCAAIAAASPEPLARLAGVAPNAKLLSCKTDFSISAIIGAYEWIEDQFDERQCPIVVSNSFGFDMSIPPDIEKPDEHPLTAVVKRVVASGMPMVFAAGNSHPEGAAKQCAPSTIWAWNSMKEVFVVAEVDQTLALRPYSSRGPGQWASAESPKPDCAAPTFGWVLYGDNYKEADAGWGTSGAAPQAAGVLALLLEQKPNTPPADLYSRLRSTSRKIELPWNCTGSGIIDCAAAVY